MMTQKTEIEKKVEKLNQLYQFYKKISQVRDPKNSYQPKEDTKK